MDYVSLITQLGLPTAILVVLWAKMGKSDEEHKKNLILKDDINRKDTLSLIEKQDKRIENMEISSKEDKKIFADTVGSFNNAISEFKAVNNNMSSIQCKLETIEKDVTEIKYKIEK